MIKKAVLEFLIFVLLVCWGCGNQGGDLDQIDKTRGENLPLKAKVPQAEAATDSDKWDGFRGLRWGTNIKEMNDPDMILATDNDNQTTYIRTSDQLGIGNAKVVAIVYGCYKGRLCMVYIGAEGYKNFTDLKDAVFAYYGAGRQDGKEKQIDGSATKWEWRADLGNSSKDVRMVLVYNELSKKTIFTMTYVPIWKEKDADKAK